MSEAFWNKWIDKQKQIEQKETSLEQKLDFLKLPWKENDYSNFIKFLETKSNTKDYNLILEKLQDWENTDDILDYIETNWYPIWKEFNKFIKDYFDIDIKEETEKKKEETEKKKEETEKKKEETEKKKEVEKHIEEEKLRYYLETKENYLNKNLNLLEKVNWTEKFIKLLKLDNPTEKDLKEIHSFLTSKWQQLFREIAFPKNNLSLDERKKLFEETKRFVGWNFDDIKIQSFEFYAWSWVEGKISPNPDWDPTKILEDVEWNLSDNMVSLDLDHIPPKYDLGRIDSDYKFKNKLDWEHISELTWEYLDEVKEFQEAGKNLWVVGKWYSKFKWDIQKLWQENVKEIQSGNFSGFKEWLDAYLISLKISIRQNLEEIYNKNLDIPNELKLTKQDFNNLWNIQNPNDLKQKFENFEQKYKALQNYLIFWPKKAYKKYKNKLQQEVIEDTKETKEKQKETLDFLHKIGFDLIPQNITNELIAEIKSNVIQVKWLNINPKSLDLKKWIFWNSWLEANSNQIFKENIIKFLNKLIYWEINPKNSLLKIESFTSVTWATINPTELQDILKKQWVKSDMYWDINKMRDNLKKEKNTSE